MNFVKGNLRCFKLKTKAKSRAEGAISVASQGSFQEDKEELAGFEHHGCLRATVIL